MANSHHSDTSTVEIATCLVPHKTSSYLGYTKQPAILNRALYVEVEWDWDVLPEVDPRLGLFLLKQKLEYMLNW